MRPPRPRPGRPRGVPALPLPADPSRARPAAALLLAALLAACAPSRLGRLPGAPPADASPPEPRFQLVYVIHGDADYIWHDSAGTRRLADLEAVAQARELAARSPAAEVLIFHQTRRRHLWSHPPKDGTFYHFRGGRLLRARDYSRAGAGLGSEAALFRRFAAAAPAAPGARMFFYFGHEIPPRGVRGYSRSRPREAFSLADLTGALARMGGPAGGRTKPFGLIALSACRGGTPGTTAALFPFADFVLASPGELHLSHLDTRPLLPLLADPSAFDRDALRRGAGEVARRSFAALSARTATAVTLSLYESDRASAWLEARPPGLPPAAGPVPGPAAHVDCTEIPGFGGGGEDAGALVLYRPPRFGKRKAVRAHSGWECPAPLATAGTR